MGRLQDQVGHDEQQRKLLREVDPIVKAAIKAGYDAEEMYHWRRDMLVYFIEGGRYKQLKNVWAKIESRLEMMMDWIDVPRDGERVSRCTLFPVLAMAANRAKAVGRSWTSETQSSTNFRPARSHTNFMSSPWTSRYLLDS